MKTPLLCLSALGGTLLLGASLLGTSRPLPKSGPDGAAARDGSAVPAPKLPVAHAAHTPQEVADRLDDLLQPRFQERAEFFGLSRIYVPLDAHQYTVHEADKIYRQPLYNLIGRSPEEKSLLTAANAANREYVVGFLHSANTLGDPPLKKNARKHLPAPAHPLPAPDAMPEAYFEPLVIHGAENQGEKMKDRDHLAQWQIANMKAVNEAVKKAAARARKGEKMEVQAGEWVLLLRPVKAAQDSCLACHGRAKKGDTLGVMAYAIRSAAAKTAAK